MPFYALEQIGYTSARLGESLDRRGCLSEVLAYRHVDGFELLLISDGMANHSEPRCLQRLDRSSQSARQTAPELAG